MSAADWFQDDDGRWSKPYAPDIGIEFAECEVDDWPPYVALRADNARLRIAIDRHRRWMSEYSAPSKVDELLYAVLDQEPDQ